MILQSKKGFAGMGEQGRAGSLTFTICVILHRFGKYLGVSGMGNVASRVWGDYPTIQTEMGEMDGLLI